MSNWRFPLDISVGGGLTPVISGSLVTCTEMRAVHIMTNSERTRFKRLWRNDYQPSLLPDFSGSTELFACRHGVGVRATQDVPLESLLGYYTGKLDRSLPPNSRYSFSVGTPLTALYINCEDSADRCKLS